MGARQVHGERRHGGRRWGSKPTGRRAPELVAVLVDRRHLDPTCSRAAIWIRHRSRAVISVGFRIVSAFAGARAAVRSGDFARSRIGVRVWIIAALQRAGARVSVRPRAGSRPRERVRIRIIAAVDVARRLPAVFSRDGDVAVGQRRRRRDGSGDKRGGGKGMDELRHAILFQLVAVRRPGAEETGMSM